MAKISIEKRPCRREGCGFTQDSKTVLRERADVETRFGLLASTQDHTHVDRRTLADIPGLILATSPQPIVINIVATVFNEITAVTFALTQ